ncbi:metal-binding protein ZinT [Orbus mooreae]|uniref:metal-binding protein ZinT n=1 Tax=Orbus mooreae TaxID=3074107 RepID=UPI00370D9C89
MILKVLPLASCLLGYCLVNSAFADSHNHGHQHEQSEQAKLAATGIFDDKDVKDRSLSDWQGNWQSIYHYLKNGDLESVLKDKAEKNNKSIEYYQDYYQKGYKTDLEIISIDGNSIAFFTKDNANQCEYKYAGYKILTYVSGKKGVRYLFECTDKNSQAPKYVQFSDHIIEPTSSSHFHIYMGNDSQEVLLSEVENWPTFYPISLKKDDIVHDMLFH